MLFAQHGFSFSNAILVEDDIRLVIDSGTGEMLQSIEPETVDVLLNSHAHLDHINGNDLFTNAVIMAHPLEIESMKDPYKVTVTKGWDVLAEPELENFVPGLGRINSRYLKPWRVDEELEDNQIIDCGTTKIVVLHTPGHTSGHCSFYFPNENFIFTADICLSRIGPWYGDPDIDLNSFVKSVDRISDLKPERVGTGHVPYVIKENIQQRFDKYINRIFKREDKIITYLKKSPCSINDIAEKKLIYRKHPSCLQRFWEKCMIKKHIDGLVRRGIVIAVDGDNYRMCE